MSQYPSNPGTGNHNTLIAFVIVIIVLAAGAAGIAFLTGGG